MDQEYDVALPAGNGGNKRPITPTILAALRIAFDFYTKAETMPKIGGTFTGGIAISQAHNLDIANLTAGGAGITVMVGGGGAAGIEFHRQGIFATFLGLNKANEFVEGGYSRGAVQHRLWTERNTTPNAGTQQGRLTHYVAAYGGSTATARQGDRLRPWGNYEQLYWPANQTTMHVHTLSPDVYANVSLNSPDIQITRTLYITGPGRVYINAAEASYAAGRKIIVRGDGQCRVSGAFFGQQRDETLSGVRLEFHNCSFGDYEYILAGCNTSFFNCSGRSNSIILVHDTNTWVSGGGSGGSGGGGAWMTQAYSGSYVNCTMLDQYQNGNALRTWGGMWTGSYSEGTTIYNMEGKTIITDGGAV